MLENYERWYPSFYTNSQSGVQIIAGGGILGELIVQTAVANATVNLYDGQDATGTALVAIVFPSTLLTNGPFAPIMRRARFVNGLYLVTAGTGLVVSTTHRLGN